MRHPRETMVAFAIAVSIGPASSSQQHAPKLELVIAFDVLGGPVNAVAFSPDGKWLASGGTRGDVVLWDVAKRSVKRRFSLPLKALSDPLLMPGLDDEPTELHLRYNPVCALAFSPDGRRLAATGSALFVFHVETGAFTTRPCTVRSALAFAPTGELAYFNGRDVEILDPKAKMVVARIKTLSAHRLAFEGDKIIVARPNGFIERFHWPSGKLADTKIFLGRLSGFARLGDKDLACYFDGRMRIGKKWVMKESRWVDVEVSRDGRRIAVAMGQKGGVYIFDHEWKWVRTLECPQGGGLADVAFSPDGVYLATAGWKGGVRLWKKGEIVATLDGHPGRSDSMAFSPDGNFLAVNAGRSWIVDVRKKVQRKIPGIGLLTAGRDGPELIWLEGKKMSVWHSGLNRAIRTRELRSEKLPSSYAALSPDGLYLAYFDAKSAPRLYDLRRDRDFSLGGASPLPGELHWHPKGGSFLLSTMTNDWEAKQEIVDTTAESLWRNELRGGGSNTPWLGRFSPSGGRFVTVSKNVGIFFDDINSSEVTVRLRSTAKRKSLATSEVPVSWWGFLSEDRALSHDGKRLKLWNVQKLAVIHTFDTLAIRIIHRAVLSRGGKRLAVDDGGRVRIFELR